MFVYKKKLINFNNDRLISPLMQFWKTLETVFENRFVKFIEQNSDSQYGFGKNRSTYLALLEMADEITNAIDNKIASIGVFIHLIKTFDIVNHNLLLKE